MKKIIALLLVLVMATAAGAAWADKLELQAGTPTQCDSSTFQMLFTFMEQQSGYDYTWDKETETEGEYTVYTARPAKGSMILKLYTLDDRAVYVVCEGSVSASFSNKETVREFGSWFGSALGGICLAFYMADHPDAPLDEELLTRFTNDGEAMLSSLTALNDGKKVAEGVAFTAPVLGYPTGMEGSGTASGQSAILNMKLVVTSEDGVLTVRK